MSNSNVVVIGGGGGGTPTSTQNSMSINTMDPTLVLISALTTTMGVFGSSSTNGNNTTGNTNGGWNIETMLSTAAVVSNSTNTSDGQTFWDNESINRSDIYQSLQSLSEPQSSSNQALLSYYDTQYPIIMKAMKYIFVHMSKGCDMSDFYDVIVLKLIHVPNYEIRKMVYIYLIQYSNTNSTTRELSLLSINSFQRGLNDQNNCMIRALALRVLTSIQFTDIVPIQILAITKHTKTDPSMYVKQCAILAIGKLSSRIPHLYHNNNNNNNNDNIDHHDDHQQQRQILLELIQYVLEKETNIVILSSAMIALYEFCSCGGGSGSGSSSSSSSNDTGSGSNDNSTTTNTTTTTTTNHILHQSLYMIHHCYYKLCHFVCDMDEYTQVIVMDILSRYCRMYFSQPYYHQQYGSAYIIDQQRKVMRPKLSVVQLPQQQPQGPMSNNNNNNNNNNPLRNDTNKVVATTTTNALDSFWNGTTTTVSLSSQQQQAQPQSQRLLPRHHQLHTSTTTTNFRIPHQQRTTIVKKKGVQKGFYSDDEDDDNDDDDNSNEDVEPIVIRNTTNTTTITPINTTGRMGSQYATNSYSTTTSFRDDNNNNDDGNYDPTTGRNTTSDKNHNNDNNNSSANPYDIEEEDIHDDHKLLLHSVRPLLKSRNAGVVLAVCTLQYYCGIASIPIRKQMGKSLVRVYKSNNNRNIEIQYVVLSAIRQFIQYDCPSAFTPFLPDFFILPNIDPNYTRMIKLDILSYLSIDPPSIIAVLNELRTYVQIIPSHNNDDKNEMDDIYFVCASIRTVGRITEIARIVYDRHAQLILSSQQQQQQPDATTTTTTTTKSQERRDALILQQYRTESNTIALNCLYGLITFSKVVHENHSTKQHSMTMIIGETIQVLQRILHLMISDSTDATLQQQQDTNHVRDQALHRILLLLVNTLSCIADDDDDDDDNNQLNDDDDEEEDSDDDDIKHKLQNYAVILPPAATASAIWLMGEYLSALPPSSLTATTVITNGTATTPNAQQLYGKFVSPQQRSKLCFELLRLLVRSFNALDPPEKEQSIHFASKILLSYHGMDVVVSHPGFNNEIVTNITPLCEHILALGRYDSIPDIRDRARFESSLIHHTVGLRYDTDGFDEVPIAINNKILSVTDVQRIFLSTKPASTYIPLHGNDYIGMNNTNGVSSDEVDGRFRFGTLSSLVGHKARSSYIPLPPWAEKNSDSSLRAEKRGETTSNSGHPTNGKEFYQSSDSDDDESSSTESSESDSESSDDESDDDSDTDSDADDAQNHPVNSMQPTPTSQLDQHFNLLHPTAASSSTSHQLRPPQIQIENATDESSSDDDDDDDDDDDESDDESSAEDLFPMASKNDATLIPIQNATTAVSVIDDMRGLVLEPATENHITAVGSTNDSDNINLDVGGWITLVRSEHSAGLLVEGRYLRNRRKIEESQRMGLLPPEKSSIAILQLRLTNQKSSGGSNPTIRHIRLLQQSASQQRSSSSSASTVGPRKMVIIPSEIAELPVSTGTTQQSSVGCVIGIDFLNASDRDGSYLAKIEMKYGSMNNSVTIDIKPTIGDMLQPYHRPCTVKEFNTSIHRMQGFSRIESTFPIVSDKKMTVEYVSERIQRRAAVSVVVTDDTVVDGNHMMSTTTYVRFIGVLPLSCDPIYVEISLPTTTVVGSKNGTVMVCCDHALVANSFLQLVKRAIIE